MYDSGAKIGNGRELEGGFACLPDFHFYVTVAVLPLAFSYQVQ